LSKNALVGIENLVYEKKRPVISGLVGGWCSIAGGWSVLAHFLLGKMRLYGITMVLISQIFEVIYTLLWTLKVFLFSLAKTSAQYLTFNLLFLTEKRSIFFDALTTFFL
jgi:hypothetical protein